MRLLFTSRSGRFQSLDSLRGVLVLVVFIYHFLVLFEKEYLPYLKGGFLAVEVFIVLSGYVITRHLLKDSPALHSFLVRRFLRIYPSMLLVVVSSVLLVYSGGFSPFGLAYKEALFSVLSLYNYFLVYVDVPYFVRFETEILLLPLWSLSLEFQLYLLTAFLFLIVPRRFIPYVFFLLVVLSASVSFYLFQVQNANPDQIYFRTEVRAHGFYLGGILAFAEGRLKHLNPYLSRVLAYTSASLIAFSFFYLDIYRDWFFPFGFLMVDMAAVALIGSLVLLNWAIRPLVWLGSISYPLFLWHYPVMLLTKYSGTDMGCAYCGMFLLIFSLSVLTHVLVEQPYRRIRLSLEALKPALYLPALFLLSLYYRHQNPPELQNSQIAPEVQTEQVRAYAHEGACRAFLIGDSVMKGAAPFVAATYRGLIIDARVNRSFKEGFDVLEMNAERVRSCDSLVVHLGHNGYVRKELLKEFIQRVKERFGREKTIYFITLKASRLSWESSYNFALREFAQSGEIRLIEWDRIAREEYLHTDGIHLNVKGAKVYREMIAQALVLKEQQTGLMETLLISHPERKLTKKQESKAEQPKENQTPSEQENQEWKTDYIEQEHNSTEEKSQQ